MTKDTDNKKEFLTKEIAPKEANNMPKEPKKDKEQVECNVPDHLRSTVMIQSLSKECSQDMLQSRLDMVGFAAQYDFLYLPKDFRTGDNIGYAFVNFVEPQAAQRFM